MTTVPHCIKYKIIFVKRAYLALSPYLYKRETLCFLLFSKRSSQRVINNPTTTITTLTAALTSTRRRGPEFELQYTLSVALVPFDIVVLMKSQSMLRSDVICPLDKDLRLGNWTLHRAC